MTCCSSPNTRPPIAPYEAPLSAPEETGLPLSNATPAPARAPKTIEAATGWIVDDEDEDEDEDDEKEEEEDVKFEKEEGFEEEEKEELGIELEVA